MKLLVVLTLGLVGVALARPSDIIDFELDHMEHEQEGEPGRAVEGEYSWVAPDGEEYVVKYVADEYGFRVVDSNVAPETHDFDLDEVEDEVPKLRVADSEEDSEEDEDDDEEEEEEEER